MTEDAGLVRTGRIAQELGVSERSVRRYVDDGGLPSYRLVEGGPLLFDLAEVREWLRTRRDGPEDVA